jgi:hypothetical protein
MAMFKTKAAPPAAPGSPPLIPDWESFPAVASAMAAKAETETKIGELTKAAAELEKAIGNQREDRNLAAMAYIASGTLPEAPRQDGPEKLAELRRQLNILERGRAIQDKTVEDAKDKASAEIAEKLAPAWKELLRRQAEALVQIAQVNFEVESFMARLGNAGVRVGNLYTQFRFPYAIRVDQIGQAEATNEYTKPEPIRETSPLRHHLDSLATIGIRIKVPAPEA